MDGKRLKEWLKGEPPQLPEGCLLDVELAARDMLKEFIPTGAKAGIEAYRAIRDELGRRPTASELFGRGYLPRAVSKAAGDWFAFVESEGDLSEVEREVVAKFHDWLRTVETTSLNKSYKMVVLRVLLDQGQLFDGGRFASRLRGSVAVSCGTTQYYGETSRVIDTRSTTSLPTTKRGLPGGSNGRSVAGWTRRTVIQWFQRTGDKFVFNHDCPERLQPVLESLTEELVDWRLAAYSKSHGLVETEPGEMRV